MTGILEKVDDPRHLRRMSTKELEKLAEELRETIINTVSETGGHLAPSLGVIELTLALHSVFETPKDKIIWDVGHQVYSHKLITGRKHEFNTLRSYGGLSGFPKREESEYDVFNTGHASTSISAALGIALARDYKGENYTVAAVIGDGALTGGMAFEALNYAGDLKRNLIVILNDNKMSIDRNVGALSSYLSRLRTDPMYFKGKEEVESLMKRIPHGVRVLKAADKLKDSFKYLFIPGILFEELGFTYLGPIDGHNIDELKSVFNNAKFQKGPILIHILTNKGKGYEPAEDKPDTFHGTGPFDIDTGVSLKKKEEAPSYTSVFGHTLSEIAEREEDVVAVTAAMPGGTGLDVFYNNYPQRYYDVGIAEQNAVTMAAGLASNGLKPVVAIYSTFLQRAFDQVTHDVCIQKLPVTFVLDRGGIVGEDGETHQGQFDISYLRNIPNMVVMSPKDENELRHMVNTAVMHDGPAAVRYPRGKGIGADLDDELELLPIGKAEQMSEGSDIAIFAIGHMVYPALEAAGYLKKKGINPAVVNCRFAKPLDKELLCSLAQKTRNVVTVEENTLSGGFGSGVLEMLSDEGMFDVKTHRIGLPDAFIKHGEAGLLREKLKLTGEGIFSTIKEKYSELF